MKTKTLVIKMSYKDAVNYMEQSQYRLPTLQEVKKYGKEHLIYWYDNTEVWYDKEYPLFLGRFAATTKGKINVNTHNSCTVLCIQDLEKQDDLEKILLHLKNNDITVLEAKEMINQL